MRTVREIEKEIEILRIELEELSQDFQYSHIGGGDFEELDAIGQEIDRVLLLIKHLFDERELSVKVGLWA